MMKFAVKVAVLGVILCCLNGCATLFGNKNRQVRITSVPNGASVYLDGSEIGKTPQMITVNDPMNPPQIRCSKPGYYSRYLTPQTKFQTIGLLNLFNLGGFIIDYITGDMKSVPSALNFTLSKRSR